MNRPVHKVALLCCLSACTLLGGSITLGTDVNGNSFPFGGTGTEYQEAYASSDFSGPLSITGIDFFLQPDTSGVLGGTYTLSLSIITANINSLSGSDLPSNIGPNNTEFTSVVLSGAAPSELTFTGGPFSYNPSLGNLLLDITITSPSGTAAFEDGAGSGPAGIVRYYNEPATTGTTGFGLVTEFDFGTSSIPEPGTLSLLGCGLVYLLLQRLRRSSAATHSEAAIRHKVFSRA